MRMVGRFFIMAVFLSSVSLVAEHSPYTSGSPLESPTLNQQDDLSRLQNSCGPLPYIEKIPTQKRYVNAQQALPTHAKEYFPPPQPSLKEIAKPTTDVEDQQIHRVPYDASLGYRPSDTTHIVTWMDKNGIIQRDYGRHRGFGQMELDFDGDGSFDKCVSCSGAGEIISVDPPDFIYSN